MLNSLFLDTRAIILILVSTGFSACQSPSVYFSGEIKGLQRDSLYLFVWDAGRWMRVTATPIREGRFEFGGSPALTGFYWWGLSTQEGDLIYLSPKEKPHLQAEASQLFQSYQIQNSPENSTLLQFRRQAGQIIQLRQQNPTDTLLQKRLDSLVQSAKQSKSEALRLYAPFYALSSISSDKPSWGELIKTVWENVPLSDHRLSQIPDLFGRFQYFWQVSLSFLPEDTLLAYMDRWEGLQKADTAIRKNALVALLVSAQQTGRQDLLLSAAERFVRAFPGDDRRSQLDALLQAEGTLRKGRPAPDIALPDPEARERRLSSLKGRWVLIDFWASWCRPCRMENPRVVQLYQKYHPKGFEILGVSLDYQKEAWIQAIRQDNLSWIHVSDLRGWQSGAAQLYRVSSIPFTVLVDPEGRIAAKGLRGQALEAKLREIYGE